MNASRPFQGERSSKRVFTRGDLGGLDVGGTSLAGPTYVVSATQGPRHTSDPANRMYDITTKLGRGKEQKEQRKRKKEDQEYLPFRKMDTLVKTRKYNPSAANVQTVTQSNDDIDKKFLDNLDHNNLAAKALSIAQATLQGKNLNDGSHKLTPTINARMEQNDATARVCILLLISVTRTTFSAA